MHRSIENHLTASSGAFRGVATLGEDCSCAVLDAPHARYSEHGRHFFNGRSTSAQRRLEFAPLKGNAVAVYFSDGRPFYDFDLSHKPATRTHVCGDDEYEIMMQVITSDVVEERWRVRGPAKNYDALTVMRRVNRGSSRTSISSFSA